MAHRLAWLYTYGSFPNGDIDHINGNGLDNRIANLRDVTRSVNLSNAKKRVDNTTGITGVVKAHTKGKWQAQIGLIATTGKFKYLGTFDEIWDAICARKSADNAYGFNKNHGREKVRQEEIKGEFNLNSNIE